MEGNSSGDDVVVAKTRKPYTITKQRERWTEEEHNRFLEALKLHGRAWQRIEEHIGTKTAVQIRSHAQKFFTKLEKEALEKGIPPGQTHDIDIPPPRPKRKPSSPYPRKSSAGSVAPSGEVINVKPLQAMPLLGTSKAMNIVSGTQREKRQTKDVTEDDGCSEVLNSFQDSLSASTCISKSSSNHSKYLEFLPTKKKTVELLGVDKSSVPREVNQKLDKYIQEAEGIPGNCSKSKINLSLGEGANTINLQGLTSKDTINGELTHLKKPPVNCTTAKDGANDMQTEDSYEQIPAATTGQLGGHGNANPSINLVTPATLQNITIGSPHHPFPAFSPFTQFNSSQDAHGSFLNISSTFSSLIVSTLLQNPAVHAAASLAASLWPSAAVETPEHPSPEMFTGEIAEEHINPTPCLEAIAAATVAAAAAWWAAQGLLSWFPHPLSGFAFPPTTISFPSADISSGQARDGTLEKPSKEDPQIGNLSISEAPKPQHHPLKTLSLSSSDSEVSGRGENLNELKGARSNKLKPLADSGFHDSDAARNKKKQDRSSCGSNTPSGSEVETDTLEKKHEKLNNESKEAYFSNCSASETNHRRFRSSGSMNESWKEVSEEGRLAFQALFKREVLPQSFSPPHMEETATEMMKAGTTYLLADFNKSASPTLNLHHLRDEDREEMRINDNLVLGKLKIRRTGFKPYKRCSVEGKENRAAAEESGNKKIRLQGEASI